VSAEAKTEADLGTAVGGFRTPCFGQIPEQFI
jgi:hypothetical protein